VCRADKLLCKLPDFSLAGVHVLSGKHGAVVEFSLRRI
jgi:hypothetical protein